ncbi:MAG: DNA polymerase III subunit delta [Pantoea sp. Brub]|nr:DNA polymerase III subunit delta [Pantoea sp. Brub]
MYKIYPEQLKDQLLKKFFYCYLLVGTEILFLNESVEIIKNIANLRKYKEYTKYILNNKTNLADLFEIFKTSDLFFQRKIIHLEFTENYFNASINSQLIKLFDLLTKDNVVICNISKLTKVIENSKWFKNIFNNSLLVYCRPVEKINFTQWIIKRTENMGIFINDEILQLFCYLYEGNLIELVQTLHILKIQWPDGKLTLSCIQDSLNNLAKFNAFQWVNALLEGNIVRAIHILKYLKQENIEIISLLNLLQRDLIILIHLKYYQNKPHYTSALIKKKIFG